MIQAVWANQYLQNESPVRSNVAQARPRIRVRNRSSASAAAPKWSRRRKPRLVRSPTRFAVLSTVLVLVVLAVQIGAIHSVSANLTWSSASLIDHYNASNNILPTALQASNGTIWLAWQTDRYGGATGRNDIIYRTMTGGTWSPVRNFTTSGMNASPELIQLLNGTVFMFWTTNPSPANSCSPHCNIRYESFNAPTQTWSQPSQLTTGVYNDSLSSATVSRDGALLVSWTRIVTTCSSTCTTTKQLYYRTLNNNVWSSETQLTTDSANWNWGPSVVVGEDGVVRVAFSKTPVSQDSSQIYYKIYNGTWSSETQIVSSSTSDEHPSLIQDRNGTFLIFWARKINVGTQGQFYYVLYDKYSFDNGRTWSAEFQITNFA